MTEKTFEKFTIELDCFNNFFQLFGMVSQMWSKMRLHCRSTLCSVCMQRPQSHRIPLTLFLLSADYLSMSSFVFERHHLIELLRVCAREMLEYVDVFHVEDENMKKDPQREHFMNSKTLTTVMILSYISSTRDAQVRGTSSS